MHDHISVAGRTLMTVWAIQRDGKLEGRRLAKKLMTAVDWGEEIPLIGFPATE